MKSTHYNLLGTSWKAYLVLSLIAVFLIGLLSCEKAYADNKQYNQIKPKGQKLVLAATVTPQMQIVMETLDTSSESL